MLPLTMIASLALLGFLGTSVNGYAISRTQDYPSYSSGSSPTQTFSSLKEAQESLASTNYASISSPRQYSTLYSGHSSSPSFGDSSPQSTSYGGHSAASDALNSLSGGYQNDAADLGSSYSTQGLDYGSSSAPQHSSSPSVTYSGYSGGQSDQLSGLEYASSAPVSASYTSAGAGSSSYGGSSPVSTSYTSQSNPGSYTSQSSAGSYTSQSSPGSYTSQSSPGSYTSQSSPSSYASQSSPVSASYSAASPAASSYTSSGPVSFSGPKSHGSSPYTSTSSVSFLAGGHQGSAPSSSHIPSFQTHSGSFSGSAHYPSDQTQSTYADSPRYPAALKNFMNSIHRESSGAYFARPSSSHGSNYIHSPASFSKGPGSYFSSGAYPKSGGKIIIVKDGSGGHAMMHPESSFSGSMSFPAGSNYKVRNAGPFASGHHQFQGSASSYSHPSVYSAQPGPSSHPGGASSPYFQY